MCGFSTFSSSFFFFFFPMEQKSSLFPPIVSWNADSLTVGCGAFTPLSFPTPECTELTGFFLLYLQPRNDFPPSPTCRPLAIPPREMGFSPFSFFPPDIEEKESLMNSSFPLLSSFFLVSPKFQGRIVFFPSLFFPPLFREVEGGHFFFHWIGLCGLPFFPTRFLLHYGAGPLPLFPLLLEPGNRNYGSPFFFFLFSNVRAHQAFFPLVSTSELSSSPFPEEQIMMTEDATLSPCSERGFRPSLPGRPSAMISPAARSEKCATHLLFPSFLTDWEDGGLPSPLFLFSRMPIRPSLFVGKAEIFPPFHKPPCRLK